jgi:hypothetical protein
MAYVEAHAALREHPKTKRAARLLGVTPVAIVGHLLFLWWWCQDYAQDGNLSAWNAEDIAEAAGWTNDPAAFVEALLICGKPGFLEIAEDGALLIHDWFQYGGKLFTQRKQGAVRQANWRARQRNESVTPLQNVSNALLTHNVTHSNAYREDKKEEKREEENPPSFSDGSGYSAATRASKWNNQVAAELRTPIADVILDIIGKRQLADIGGALGDKILDAAHECAVTIYKLGYKTPSALLDIEPEWRQNWRGKDGGGTPEQLATFCAERNGKAKSNGNGKAPIETLTSWTSPDGRERIIGYANGQELRREPLEF